ncbi:hypothetical protein JAAARDRAFT_69639 [Jaapia argillacea MUCL 33604]|uniref:Csf1 N-terminal domain-containing protein n=1 Tax=Jaapia argillacea MUCL 33604 TaxID=933084 RepID=A0A067PUI5_9AGAM|nr:hypothetical protein JAAARDRAFT_69639 [Jaapia argillacea MUCL 33604]
MVNGVLLAACISVVVGLVLYLFYWNRFLAFGFGILIKVALWSQGASNTWIEFGSIHFSLLAGRILLKDFRYYSSNQTIKIVKGQISWRYWIRGPANEEDLSHARLGAGDFIYKPSSWPLNCRVHISVQGLEWFMYNRTPAYDNILSQMRASGVQTPDTPQPRYSVEDRYAPLRHIFSKSPQPASTTHIYPPASLFASSIRPPRFVQRAYGWIKDQLPTLDPKDLLPIGIEVTKAAIIIGNQSTPTLLVADFRQAEGTFGIVPSRSKCDLYKQILNLKFKNAVLQYVDNPDYQEPMPEAGEKISEQIKQSQSRLARLRGMSYLVRPLFAKVWRNLRLYPWLSGLYHPADTRHHPHTFSWGRKRAKSLDEETPIGPDFLSLEYAAEHKILEAPDLELIYYTDVVGQVPTEHGHRGAEVLESFDIGNGDFPPEWGVDLVIHSGFIRYGPWADRQRAELQKVFFPPSYLDSTPTPRLKPGDTRTWTSLKVFVELRDGTTLHIPFREASKNWQWDGQSDVPRPRKREPGYIHVKASDGSTINYILPMVIGEDGYEPQLEVHLDAASVTSSLNDIRLLTTESCRIRCEFPSSLKWNGERQWNIGVSLRQPTLYLIRDHINMFTDLGKDWSSGPPSDYNRFMPMVYVVDFDMHAYELNLYVNDQNIIDKPLIREENALLTLRGSSLKTRVEILSNKFRPVSTTVPFCIEAPHAKLSLTLPKWNTHSINATRHRTDFGQIGQMRLDGSYMYYAEVRPDNVEQLKLDFTGRDVVWKAFGWTVRQIMIFRENYFGTFTHFSTLYEYLEKRKNGLPAGDPVEASYRKGKSNVMEVELQVDLDQNLVMLPAGMHGDVSKSSNSDDVGVGPCVMLTIPGFQVQLRSHDYYMDMSLNIGSITGFIEPDCSEKLLFGSPRYHSTKETFVIDGLDIAANRLFGPQPRTSTYLCIWEIQLGSVRGALSLTDTRVLSSAGSAFGVNFGDPFNTPATEYAVPLDPDVTFVRVSVHSVDVTWLAGNAALHINLPSGLRMDSNDLATGRHRSMTSFRLPRATVRALQESGSAPRTWLEAASFTVDCSIDMYSSPLGWRESASRQKDFVAAQDSLTRRASFLFDAPPESLEKLISGRSLRENGLYLPRPRLPRDTVATSSMPPVQHHQPQASRGTPLIRDGVLSDSDSDEIISEADRDARLAKSRPTTPNPRLCWEDQSMSSGDESDDADLTDDADHSDTDASDCGDGGNSPTVPARVYRKISKYFRSPSLKSPSRWEKSCFYLSKDRPVFQCPSFPSSCPPCRNEVALAEHLSSLHPSDDLASTTIHVENKEKIFVFLTPMVLSVAVAFLDESQKSQPDPELYLDSLVASYVASFSQSNPGKRMVFDVSLSSICAQFLLVAPALDGGSTEDLSGAARFSRSKHTLAVAELQAEGCRVKGDISSLLTDQRRELTFTLDSPSIVLGTIQAEKIRRGGRPQFPLDLVCGAHARSFQIGVKNDEVHVFCDSTSAHAGYGTSQHLLAAHLALAGQIHAVTAAQKRASDYARAVRYKIVRRILDMARNKSVVDPLSTMQPSYLVQVGRPRQLRTSTAFKVLLHLRQCLRQLSAPERQSLAHPESYRSAEETRAFLHDQILALSTDLDSQGPPDILLVEKLLALSAPLVHSPNTRSPPFRAVVFQMYHLSALVQTAPQVLCSELTVDTFTVAVNTSLSEMVHASSSKSSARGDLVPELFCQVALKISFGRLHANIFPPFVHFLHNSIRAHHAYVAFHPSPTTPPTGPYSSPKLPPSAVSRPPLFIEAMLAIDSLRVRAVAESLTSEMGTSGLSVASSALVRHVKGAQSYSLGVSGIFRDVFIRARATAEMSNANDHDILASFVVSGGKASIVVNQDGVQPAVLRTVGFVDTVQLAVPRSALRLYRFVEDWKADYLPAMKSMVDSLLVELSARPNKDTGPSRQSSRKHPIVHAHLAVSHLGILLQIMPDTWLSWDVKSATTYMRASATPLRKLSHSFGVQLGSQVISVSSRPKDTLSNDRVRLKLPAIVVTGHYDEYNIQLSASMEFFYTKLRPSHWDVVVLVQQKFGQDFDDLVLLVQQTRAKYPSSPSKKPAKPAIPWKFTGSLKMRGFRIGLEGASSMLFFECNDIGGEISTDIGNSWSFGFSDLALSLAPRSSAFIRDPTLNRSRQTAFVSIDFKASAGHSVATSKSDRTLELAVTKIHAVMQPSSIGEIGDFVDHLQAEILVRREERATELAHFREKTKQLMTTFDLKVRDKQLEPSSSWLHSYNVNFTMKNIGVAFPLALDQELGLPQPKSEDSNAVRAFLFSIKSFAFNTHRGESGAAVMKAFSFQFVSHFSQSRASDFSGEHHKSQNRLLYPEMTAHLRLNPSPTSRKVRVSASVSGFVLDLDSTIPDYVFSLIDVYRQGKERVERLAANIPRTTTPSNVTPHPHKTPTDIQYSALPTSNILTSLTFLSGKVRVHHVSSSGRRTRTISVGISEITDEPAWEYGAEIINLPVVSVWGEYRATPAAQKMGGVIETEPSVLIFKSTIHSSQNTLRPTLLPFLTDVVRHVEDRMRISTWQHMPQTPSFPFDEQHPTVIESQARNVSSIQISFSLRIDQSKLELTCQPDVNVIAGLHWDSGGFVVNITPGAKQVTFTASVAGLTVGLKHGFLSEDCVRLDARNLVCSTTFAKVESASGEGISSVSFVLDTEFAGGVRFSRLQDVLCFKAVWLDRIPLFSGQGIAIPSTPAKSAIPLPSISPTTKHQFSTVLLIRVRQIKLDVDLGQSISTVGLDLRNVVVRTRLTEVFSELSLSVADLSISASGNVSGHANVPSFVFQTIRRREGGAADGDDLEKLLELSMTSGALDILLESENRKLLQYRADPLEVLAYDDWSMVSPHVADEDRPLHLSFAISGGEVIAILTVGTIPRLVSYANKFKANMDLQRAGASRESKAFRTAQSPKPDNPLSAVASAMLHSARTRFKEAESGFSYVIRQRMSLRLDFLRLVVFPRAMTDPEMAQFVGCDVRASLARIVESDRLPLQRDLNLSFQSITVSRFNQLSYGPNPQDAPLDAKRWLYFLTRAAPEAIIFGLPSMDMNMSSKEFVDGLAKTLEYSFNSKFRRSGVKTQEDIYITLNISLYSWLTVLRKNFAREMDQAQASSDRLTPLSPVTSLSASMGRKVAEDLHSLHIPDGMPRNSPPQSPRASLIKSSATSHSRSPSALIFNSKSKDVPSILTSSPIGPSTGATALSQPSSPTLASPVEPGTLVYRPKARRIERLTMRQLGEATPDITHPFFMKKAGFNLEDSLPQYVHEYATKPLEEIMKALLELYSKQLRVKEDSTSS